MIAVFMWPGLLPIYVCPTLWNARDMIEMQVLLLCLSI